MCSIAGRGAAARGAADGAGQAGAPAEAGRPAKTARPRDARSDDTGGRGGTGRRGDTGGPDGVDRLGHAIDELATAAQAGGVTAQEVAARLAGVWQMVADLDPELARRLAGYDR